MNITDTVLRRHIFSMIARYSYVFSFKIFTVVIITYYILSSSCMHKYTIIKFKTISFIFFTKTILDKVDRIAMYFFKTFIVSRTRKTTLCTPLLSSTPNLYTQLSSQSFILERLVWSSVSCPNTCHLWCMRTRDIDHGRFC